MLAIRLAVVIVFAGIEVGKGLTIGVDHFEATGQTYDTPGRRKTAVAHLNTAVTLAEGQPWRSIEVERR